MSPAPKGSVTIPIFLLILAVDVLNVLAELAFKYGAMAPGLHTITVSNFATFIRGLSVSGGIWLGVACYLVMFFCWMTVLSKVELSVAFPFHSLDYLLVPLFSMLVLHERVAGLRWLGIALIIGGVGFVSQSATPKHQSGA